MVLSDIYIINTNNMKANSNNIQKDRDSHFIWFLVAMGLSLAANMLSTVGDKLVC